MHQRLFETREKNGSRHPVLFFKVQGGVCGEGLKYEIVTILIFFYFKLIFYDFYIILTGWFQK
jgi:hypothetical protein